jgi:hypothetical protein
MPGGFPLGLDICNCNDQGSVTGSSRGTALTGGTNAYGAFVQLVASTPFDTSWISVIGSTNASVNSSPIQTVELAVGAGGSEKVIAADLVVSAAKNGYYTVVYSFPLGIPKGTRLSAAAYSTAANTSYASVLLFDGAFTMIEGAAGVDSIGWSAGAGTHVVTGIANTLGSYAQLTAATARDYIGILFVLDSALQTPLSGVDNSILLDIAVGAGGSEKNIIQRHPYGDPYGGGSTQNTMAFPASSFFPIAIPSGTRISARAQCTVATQTFGLTVYGVYQ